MLLKYDITVDKFLGDGVLGFSNAPIAHKDYVERVITAATEILHRLEMREEDYSAVWGEKLKVTIGIAVGRANIGFYGSDDSVKSYTALGPVVNLASRLCGHGHPDQIITHQEVVSGYRMFKTCQRIVVLL